MVHDNQTVYNLNEMYSSEATMAATAENDKELLIPSSDEVSVRQILPVNSVNRPFLPQEGDIIGVTYNHEELNFYLNGKNLNVPLYIKMQNLPNQNTDKEIYPCLHVSDGAILDVILNNFKFTPPSGYEAIMIEQSLL